MVSGIVLAAGLSARMGGRPKALLPVGDDGSFVTRIVRTLLAGGLSDVVVVVGHEHRLVEAALQASGLPVRSVVNPRFESGQLSSLQAGLDAVDREGVDGAMIALVDAPLFGASTVGALMTRFTQTGAPVVRPVRGGEHGHPVLVGRPLFEAIRQADARVGAKPVMRQYASAAGDVAVDDDGAFVDIDTPDDYARELARWGLRAGPW